MTNIGSPPTAQIIGEIDHPEFQDAIALLRRDARLVASADSAPELIVVAQGRPDTICAERLRWLQRGTPLSGMVALAGSWCEGETRTGRPWPGVLRLYWYEFPAWWRRQLQLRAANRCPDWARPANQMPRQLVPGHPERHSGLVVLRTPLRDNADALADALSHAGYATTWQRHSRATTQTRGARIGIWDGGQLSDNETADLAAFCTQMSRDGAPVIALLDFPRRDRVEKAREVGATNVLGKPWLHRDLVTALQTAIETTTVRRAA